MKAITKSIVAFLCVTFIFSSSIKAQGTYFLDKKGAEVEYVVKDAKGAIQSYMKMIVTDLQKKDAKNFTVTYSTEVFDKNKKSLAAPITSTTEVIDGVITMDPTASMGDSGAEVSGTYPTFPATFEVGQDIGKYEYKMKMMGMTTTVSGSSKVVAKENVTTDAGSFDCFKVESEVNTKAMMSNTKVSSASWYAKGIGAVKTETYDKKGKVQSVQELVSMK